MAKRTYRLLPSQLATLQQNLTGDNPRKQRRAQALLLLHDGNSLSHVARTVGVARQSIYNWIRDMDMDDQRYHQHLLRVVIQAMQEQSWAFADLHPVIEQRMGVPVKPTDLWPLILIAHYQMPWLHPVTDLV
ncbi:MAG: hypothetical protein CL610_19965 [Anaerolineaceae bacterium]|nr:hypothetical protein [Anaerolineaceae bacterium]